MTIVRCLMSAEERRGVVIIFIILILQPGIGFMAIVIKYYKFYSESNAVIAK